MFRRVILLAAPLALIAATAHASGGGKEDEKTGVGQFVDLSPVALPIIANGRLVNYVFATVRFNLAAGANTVKVREKEPFLRDALVRAAHSTPFTYPKDLSRADVAKLSAVMMKASTSIVGPGVVKSVVVTSQTPKKYIATPQPAKKP
jgi:hypothetical protein